MQDEITKPSQFVCYNFKSQVVVAKHYSGWWRRTDGDGEKKWRKKPGVDSAKHAVTAPTAEQMGKLLADYLTLDKWRTFILKLFRECERVQNNLRSPIATF